jgi:glycerol-1-phosphate dehydrogenase [NAD(P)+]
VNAAVGGGDPLAALIAGRWRDPDDGSTVAVPVRAIAIERTLAGTEGERIAALGLGARLAVVADERTRAALGARVERALDGPGRVVSVVLDGVPHADAATAQSVRRACAAADALVAVGSGTINDLCKHAAAADRKPYVVFATAPSMNGYTSVNAAITVDGHKLTLPASAPVAVFVDLEVLAAAPVRMIRAGLGDSLCRPTAQADWLLSHRALGTPYRQAPFALLAADEALLLDAPEALVAGDLAAMRALARTLLLSGLGMTICGGSFPASQGEHLVSHYLDMFAPRERAHVLHGEQVGVATLTMARLQEEILAGEAPRLRAPAVSAEVLAGRFGAAIGASCWAQFAKKPITVEALATVERRLRESWDDTVRALRAVALPAARIESVLRRAGCPVAPEDIDVAPALYAQALRNARFLRDRYTFLDLAADAGRLAADGAA